MAIAGCYMRREEGLSTFTGVIEGHPKLCEIGTLVHGAKGKEHLV